MIFAAGPTEPISWDFSRADLALMGTAVVGLAIAAIALRRGPQETQGFGRAELASWVLGTGFLAYVVAQPWFYGRPTEGSDPGRYFALIGFQRLLVALLAIAGMRILLTPGNPAGLTAPRRGRLLLWAVVLYLAVLPFMLLLGRFNGDDVQQTSARLLTESSDSGTRLAMFFALVLATPLFEEVIFRGCFQGGLRRIMGPEVSVMIASGVFMLVHHPPAVWPQVLCLGALLGIVYERTRTLWAPVCLHLLHNGLTFGYLTLFHE